MSLSILKNLWTCEKESDNGMELVVLVQADFIRVLALSGGKLCDCSAKIFMDQHLPRDKPSRTNKNPLGFPYTRIAQLWWLEANVLLETNCPEQTKILLDLPTLESFCCGDWKRTSSKQLGTISLAHLGSNRWDFGLGVGELPRTAGSFRTCSSGDFCARTPNLCIFENDSGCSVNSTFEGPWALSLMEIIHLHWWLRTLWSRTCWWTCLLEQMAALNFPPLFAVRMTCLITANRANWI